jgi:hypothetical protein
MNTIPFPLLTAFVILCFIEGCAAAPRTNFVVAAGEIGGDSISSEVDSEIARYFLENHLRGKRKNAQFDAKIDSILKETSRKPLTNEMLKAIADETSADFSAMVFAHLQTQRNLDVKMTYLREYELVKQGSLDLREASARYKIVLIPGLFYLSKPETKGDLREVNATLEAEGFEVVGIPIQEAGTVEQNARIIADFIKNEPMSNKKIILVSTSKGGPETIYALGHLLSKEDGAKISMWFSVGGALRGSLLADQWKRWPYRWLVSVVGLFKGFSTDMVASLSVAESMKRMAQVEVPSHVRIVHFVGVPLSGTVIDEVRGSYKALLPYGPNDGITLLPDEIVKGSTVITALGLDHWYRDPDLKRKILALVATVTLEKCINPVSVHPSGRD